MHRTAPSGRAQPQLMRPIHQKPSWLETIVHRPIRIECWACLHPAWLHRSQRDATPSDWTCPHCSTHQRRDKDGNIEPVPEMFDGSLNEDVTEHVAHSLRNRKRPNSRSPNNNPQGDVFCEMCNGHQRVVYQLLSNYIPDEEDENYEAYFENADNYRRQLEERYPLACATCLDKVQKKLAQQNYRIKSGLLNSTLSKSRGDRISPTRKYPTLAWLTAGSSWLCSHAALLSVEVTGLLGEDVPTNFKMIGLARRLVRTTGSWTPRHIGDSLSKVNLAAVLPWSSSYGQLLQNPSAEELSALAVLSLAGLSVAGLYWDPLDFVAQKAPQTRIKTRRYYPWVRIGAASLLPLQFLAIISGLPRSELSLIFGVLLALHLLYLSAFLTGRSIRQPLDFKFERPAARTPDLKSLRADDASPGDRHKLAAGSPAPLPVSSRQSARASDNFMFSTSPSSLEFPASRPGSPDINEINWSPRKPSSAASVRPPAAFGMYRDSNHADEQEGISFQASSRPGSAGSAYGQQNVRSAPSIDNRFHARAYEPSPLANPSLITNMGLSNMSLGEMFGFPSAKFQPPENHFAHRSTRQNREQGMDAWSYRKAAGSGGLNPTRSTDHRASAPAPSRFSGGADVDMDDDEESWSKETFGAPEPFAAQRYFPQERETGLEDNFFGIVKIVDDYLPPQEGPRSIIGRNLMLKKRLARRWAIVILLCRGVAFWNAIVGWSSGLDWICQAVYVGVMLHATAFWILDEYRAVRRYFEKKHEPANKKSPAAADPFDPTTMDKLSSNAILLLLLIRMLNTSSILSDKISSLFGQSGEGCSQHGSYRGLAMGLAEGCGRPMLDQQSVMDWSQRVIQWAVPWIQEQDAVNAVACRTGLVQDSLIIALLAALIVCGAGLSSGKSHSGYTQTRPSPAK
ncbi:Ima1 N-terminal domain-containing protein [Dissophora ornata]|nr:Ima1 N-terminal domain-containing protein [Dissophora ornata]